MAELRIFRAVGFGCNGRGSHNHRIFLTLWKILFLKINTEMSLSAFRGCVIINLHINGKGNDFAITFHSSRGTVEKSDATIETESYIFKRTRKRPIIERAIFGHRSGLCRRRKRDLTGEYAHQSCKKFFHNGMCLVGVGCRKSNNKKVLVQEKMKIFEKSSGGRPAAGPPSVCLGLARLLRTSGDMRSPGGAGACRSRDTCGTRS